MLRRSWSGAEVAATRRLIALICVGWVTSCAGFHLKPDPLAPGMSPRDAANRLRAPLTPVATGWGFELYVVDRPARIAGFGPVTERTFLQFQNGYLLGWNSGWRQ